MRVFWLSILSFFLVFPLSVQATMIYMDGVEYDEIQAVADFNYFGQTDSTGMVSIDLANTSLIESVLTAFAFNAPNEVTGATLSLAPNENWEIDFNRDSINTPGQFGLFDIAGVTGPNFNGGNTNYGIATGFDGLFEIDLSGFDMLGLTTDSFLNLFSFLDGKVGEEQYFIARFQGVGPFGEGSDVAIPGPNVIPEPSTFILLGVGLAGIVFLKRKSFRIVS